MRNATSPPAPLQDGEGGKKREFPAPLQDGEGGKKREFSAPLQCGEGSKKREEKEIPLRSVTSSTVVAHQYVDDYKKNRARELRKDCTQAEEILWARLRNRQIDGFKFRRQQVIAGFIADFFCDEPKLVIEVDGSIHELESVKQKDRRKENVFIARGLFVLRFKNEQVINEVETVINEIKNTSHKRLGK